MRFALFFGTRSLWLQVYKFAALSLHRREYVVIQAGQDSRWRAFLTDPTPNILIYLSMFMALSWFSLFAGTMGLQDYREAEQV